MKIINIVLTTKKGGLEQVFCDYSLALKNLGCQVLAVVKSGAPYVNQVKNLQIEVAEIENKWGYHDISAIKNLQNIIKKFEPHLIISHAGRSHSLVKKAILSLNFSKNSWLCAFLPTNYFLAKINRHKIFHIAVNHSNSVKRSIGAQMVFSVNRQIFYKTIDYGQPQNRSFVLHNAINLEEEQPSFAPINLMQKPVIILGAIGRIEKSKGFDRLITALSLLEKNISGYKFMLKIAGEGKEKNALIDLANYLELPSQSLNFCGWIQDKAKFFNSVDIFILPSISETFGLVLLEAMKFKKPIIATNCHGPKEIFLLKLLKKKLAEFVGNKKTEINQNNHNINN